MVAPEKDAAIPADDLRRPTRPCVYATANVYNAPTPPRSTKLAKPKYDDASSTCTASEAGTVLVAVATQMLASSWKGATSLLID